MLPNKKYEAANSTDPKDNEQNLDISQVDFLEIVLFFTI